MLTNERIERDLTNLPPTGQHVIDAFEQLREPAKAFARALLAVCPDTPERERAYERLQESLAAGVAAIARNQHLIPEK